MLENSKNEKSKSFESMYPKNSYSILNISKPKDNFEFDQPLIIKNENDEIDVFQNYDNNHHENPENQNNKSDTLKTKESILISNNTNNIEHLSKSVNIIYENPIFLQNPEVKSKNEPISLTMPKNNITDTLLTDLAELFPLDNKPEQKSQFFEKCIHLIALKEIEILEQKKKIENMEIEKKKIQIDKKKLDEEVKNFRTKNSTVPKFNISESERLFKLGKIKDKEGIDIEMAIALYKKSLDWNPNMFKSLNNLGLIFYKNNQFGKAEVYYDEALIIEGENLFIHTNIAILFFDKSCIWFKEIERLQNIFNSLKEFNEGEFSFLANKDEIKKVNDLIISAKSEIKQYLVRANYHSKMALDLNKKKINCKLNDNLGYILYMQYKTTNDLAYIGEALEYFKNALEIKIKYNIQYDLLALTVQDRYLDDLQLKYNLLLANKINFNKIYVNNSQSRNNLVNQHSLNVLNEVEEEDQVEIVDIDGIDEIHNISRTRSKSNRSKSNLSKTKHTKGILN